MARTAAKRRATPIVTVASEWAALGVALKALDGVLTLAVDRQARLLGPASLLDPWRGMHLEQADIERLLRSPDTSAFFGDADASVPDILANALRTFPRAALIADELQLSPVDLAALLIVLAPDLDQRYERIYGYLQDDITRKRPTLDLISNLLARNVEERLAVRARFAGHASVVRLNLLSSQGAADASPLARPWRVDELWRKWLLRESDIDAWVGSGVRLIGGSSTKLDELALTPDLQQRLRQAIEMRRRGAMQLRLLIQGPHGAGKFSLAKTLAAELGLQLLVVDLRECATANEACQLLQRAHRAAVLFDAVLYLHGVARLDLRDPQVLRALFEILSGSTCSYLLSCAAPLPPVHVAALPLLRIDLAYPDAAARRSLWHGALAARGLRIEADDEQRIAARFSLSAPQIQQAVAETHVLAMTTSKSHIGYAELAAAVRMQCGTELARMAQRVTPRADFSALVVPSEVQIQLREICARVATRDTVGREWSDGSVHARATGVTALFVGSSGTGKTLSAEALARELGLDMYRIDLAGIVSKYIGETEKNLDRVFAAAEHANAVLFFDEADALFGKRSEVKDAHDRYANIEVAYLLQKMEQFDGLAILATNLKQNLDEAFARRLTFTVSFPFPEEPERRRLWEQLWPPRAPRNDDIDLAWFAREFRLSGGNIRNTVMAAAHLAAAEGKTITREHLLHATRREYQKLGKNLVHPVSGDRRVG